VSLSLRILAVLPQTQCTRCGYPDCEAYAIAIENQEAGINQCPPGGEEGIQRLSAVTGLPALPLNPENGLEGPRHIAWIDEQWCIGCTLCISACPTDAILGASKQMHTVIEDACTGCELCLPVCPVDCIHLENVTLGNSGWNAWTQELADQAKKRYALKKLRLSKEQVETHLDKNIMGLKQSAVQAALDRAKEQK
jgi:electron transport complex protein RnfB